MAVLLRVPPHPHLHSFSFTRSTSTTQLYHRSHSPPPKALTTAAAADNNDVALLWFKHDLRIDDHPALVTSASHYQSLLPLYIFDQRIISGFSDEKLEVALLALQDLKSSLQDQGSNLMIRFGEAQNVIPQLVNEVLVSSEKSRGIDVFAEEEVEFKLREMVGSVEESLSQGRTNLVLWKTPFYDIENLKKLPAFYSDFKKLKLSFTNPLAPPVLPHLDNDLDWGNVPSIDEVKSYYTSLNPKMSNERWTSIKRISAISVLSKRKFNQVQMPSDVDEVSQKSNSIAATQIYNVKSQQTMRESFKKSVFASKEGNVVGGGTRVVLNALAAYLRYLEGTPRDDWQEVHEKLRSAEKRSGSSFGALFCSALSLGIISRRRVYYEAIKYERERNGGFLSPFGYSAATVSAAADTVCSMEWYWLLALKSQAENELGLPVRIWRWNDHLIQYTVLGEEGPAVLLVHGFGAFLEHFRDNITPMADSRHRVWALSLLGFGKSEKPNVVYTELMWSELLRDFIIDVVGEPVHLVGNSIGGYFSAIVAGLWPALAKSIVLINTAGSVITGDPPVPVEDERQISRAAWLGSRLLLSYLRVSVGSIVKNCYPSRKERADDWLINAMLRASHDPGVVLVLESVFSFNLSIPLNYLFESFGGKVLIVQGMKDPLSNSEKKISMLREHCHGIELKQLDAGHCPHDEQPEEVNAFLREWIANIETSTVNSLI